jgi:oxygen-independent coproporphyrinogen-3 oxidase
VPEEIDQNHLRNLLKKYDRPGPRYTSYPMVPVWNGKFGPDDYREALTEASHAEDQPLSFYLHIPFCRKRCWFCGCTTTALKSPDIHAGYLDLVEKECSLAAQLLGARKKISQLHWGGGTPSCLSDEQTIRAFEIFSKNFRIIPDAEISIELDPRVTNHERIALLKKLGFNRLSLGIQDFDSVVQTAIGRSQDESEVIELYRYCRQQGFAGINFDLIYGLPGQTQERFANTLKKTIELKPDRVALYNFAYLPKAKPHQKKLDPALMPGPEEKLKLFYSAREMFLESGYRLIGMDHFVLPEDELAVAAERGKLRRNFMGYTVLAARDWIGFGMSSISYINQCFAQNISELAGYREAIADGGFATFRGLKLSADDIIRQYLISELMCNFRIDIKTIQKKFNIEFGDYFAEEKKLLRQFEDDRLLKRVDDHYVVTDLGKLFVRNISMVFDVYLKDSDIKVQFSRTV